MNHFTLFKQSLRHLNLPGNVMRSRADEVDFSNIDHEMLEGIIEGLFYTMYASDGGVGLAAPMVGVTLRIMVADLRDGKPPMVLINPEVIDQSEEEEEDNEANLCLPEIVAKVMRPKWIKYKGYDQQGGLVEGTAEGFLARVILHEIEVMDGKMFHDNLPKEKIKYVAPDVLAMESLDRLYEKNDDTVSADSPSESCSLILNPITVSPAMHKLKDNVLRKTNAPLKIKDWPPDQLKLLVRDMIWLQHHLEGVGIAAPQVGLNLQMTVIDNRTDPPYVLINPVIVEKSEETENGREGCLSLPYQYGNVDRSTHVSVDALDIHGNPYHLDAEGFLAVIVQHEIDHLNGILFPDHFESPEQLQLNAPDVKTQQTLELLYPQYKGTKSEATGGTQMVS